MKRATRWIPGVKCEATDRFGLKLLRAYVGGGEVHEYLQPADQRWLGDCTEGIDWPAALKRVSDTAEVIKLRQLAWELDALGVLLHEADVSGVWWCPKQLSYPRNGESTWQGFGTQTLIVRDEHEGFWLEHPGADVSLWAPQASGFAAWLDGAELPEELKEQFCVWGFGGERLSPAGAARSVGENFFLETTRRLSRLGDLRRESAPWPLPTRMTDWPILSRGSRKSVRGHEARKRIHVQELNRIAEDIFRPCESRLTPYYGDVHRLPGPAGGGAWEHVVYLWVRECEGLTAGAYQLVAGHWQALKGPFPTELWGRRADQAWGLKGLPQVVLSLHARADVLARRYRRISVQLAHLNGALRAHEVQLAAEARGLACCWLGGGILNEISSQDPEASLGLFNVCDLALGGLER